MTNKDDLIERSRVFICRCDGSYASKQATALVADLRAELTRIRFERDALKADGEELHQIYEALGIAGNMSALDEIRRLREERDGLRKAAEAVCWFDWSDNDDDAVAAIADLQNVLRANHSGDR